jgi:hypothetical protein
MFEKIVLVQYNFFNSSQSGDQQYEDLAKFGYRQDMKVYFKKNILLYCGQPYLNQV